MHRTCSTHVEDAYEMLLIIPGGKRKLQRLSQKRKDDIKMDIRGLNIDKIKRFEILRATKIQVSVFWVVTPCSDVVSYKRFVEQ
jgi:hypothetical protein